jgi:predicted enzyme related to lactoylglutathione lyase
MQRIEPLNCCRKKWYLTQTDFHSKQIIMKKTVLTILTLAATFYLGFAFNSFITASKNEVPLKKVTGIGGIFFKCKDPKAVREWYKTNLGLHVNAYGAVFEWRQGADTTKKGFTQWSPFSATTKYFLPSEKDFMINFRVADLESLVAQLKRDGVNVTDNIMTAEYGKFVHIMDIEGNKIELWEPNDEEYEKMGIKMGAVTTK